MGIKMATGLVYHELCMWHDAGNVSSFVPTGLQVQPDRHAEEPETKRRIRNLLEVSGLLGKLELIQPEPAEIAQIARVHPQSYIDRIKEKSRSGGGEVGLNTFIGNEGFDIARISTGGAISVMDRVLDGRVRNGYALVRPPATMPARTRRWGFAFSPTRRSPFARCRKSTSSIVSQSSTGMRIMATDRKRFFMKTLQS